MGELKFSNLGLPLTIQISLTFKEGKVYSADVGELLNIGFMDDSHVEILSSSKRLGTGAVLYTLIRAKKDKIMSYEDKILYEKLRDIRIDSLRFSVNNVSHELIVSQPKADSIRNIVGCLIEHHITIDQKP